MPKSKTETPDFFCFCDVCENKPAPKGKMKPWCWLCDLYKRRYVRGRR